MKPEFAKPAAELNA